MSRGLNNGIHLKNMRIMSSGDMAMQEGPPKLSDHRYGRALKRITLLKVMQEIDNKEVKRLINLLESPDGENWVVAEECIKQKLS
jgi:hypothetical protein